MDPITNAKLASVPALPRPKSSGGSAQHLLPKPSGPALPVKQDQGPDVAELRRLERVRRAAEDIANTFVLGDSRFTIFKDATGQYITRFTNLRDGQVTYIPEPELLRRSQSSAPAVSLDV